MFRGGICLSIVVAVVNFLPLLVFVRFDFPATLGKKELPGSRNLN